MSDKIKKIYEALVEGATAGHSGNALFADVVAKCPKATSKKIVKASLLALSDSHIKDANVLHVIYALAIKHRLDPLSKDDLEPEQDDAAEMAAPEPAPVAPAKKARRRKSASATGASATA